MLSGRKPFHGASAADTLSAILKEHPPELGQTVHGPASCRRSHRRALPREGSRGSVPVRRRSRLRARRGVGVLHSASLRRHRRRAGDGSISAPRWRAAIAVAIAASAAAPWFAAKSAPEFRQLTFRRGTVQGARFAPDGQTIVYGAAWEGNPTELFSTRPEAPEARSLQMTVGRTLRAVVEGRHGRGARAARLRPRRGHARARGARWRRRRVSSRERAGRGLVRRTARSWRSRSRSAGTTCCSIRSARRFYDPTPGNITHIRFSPSGDAIAFLSASGLRRYRRIGDARRSEGRRRTLSTGWNSVLGLGLVAGRTRSLVHGNAERAPRRRSTRVTRAGRERLLVARAGDVDAARRVARRPRARSRATRGAPA